MKSLSLLLLFGALGLAQPPNPVLLFASDPSGTCPSRRLAVSLASGNLFYCNPMSGNWAVVTSGGAPGTVTSVAATAPVTITPNPTTTTGTVACPTCTTNAGIQVLTNKDVSSGTNTFPAFTGDATTTFPALTIGPAAITNSKLANPSVTVSGVTCTLGSTCSPASGASITSGTFASLPGTCTHSSTQSDLYIYIDSPYFEAVCTATNTFTTFLPFWGQVTVPPSAGWTFDNQASATVSSTNGELYFSFPGSGADNLTAYRRPLSGNVTILALIRLMPQGGGAAQCGFGIDLSDGTKHLQFELVSFDGQGAAPRLRISQWPTTTSAPSTQTDGVTGNATNGLLYNTDLLMRLVIDSTNNTWSYSFDGQRFIQFAQAAKAAFLTATTVGVSAYQHTACDAQLLSWSGA